MTGFFVGTLATIVTVPILALIMFYIIARFITKNNKRSFHVAIDISTFFFISAVHFLIIIIWDQSLLWVIFTVLLGIATLMVLLNYKIKEEIHFGKVLKGFWRCNFLLFSFTYFCLTILGVVKRVYESFA
ncbi:hypothetical protein AB685_11695 [Bacillus sp. LL01]|uniref:DUF3397 domain-containing protein n=1 Tax=Bacillus sp. LL01 TaxID=1665556 RepID=UPI00064D6EBB|nr:DUF3397 domain-containing protein [Bacillus sp. LL01]KMJ58532.1 hypothetical protein AB685_11695 [Bacillus sp. LL01]